MAANLREDGRGKDDYRPFTLDLSRAFSNTNGAARVHLTRGTDVVVRVKLEVGAPNADTPDQGRLEVSVFVALGVFFGQNFFCQFAVECSALASPLFEARGGDKLSMEIAQILRRMSDYPGACDLKVNAKMCWALPT